MSTRTDSKVEVVPVSDDDAYEMFDQVTREQMGIPAAEFLARWDAGEFEGIDFDSVPGLVEVWMYLPFVR
ncbi:hypothetical protein LWP59_02690 [Amycolatopsis acidiphila]|uniref:Uncharacterized protein n=1 Tax=Amycolatopsis acidiphila TaxID=715473 RepID=A0A558A3R5_9PSEU|nr:hypothetical protein [Amycolatopsis acidiphila]TVT18912.1 hypothetical protein FNH06_26130 [Amycolatopsis acidiphila]UIJ60611.1 hypothetical protein LWP59_02690 [Amycolatopsis acidiphila]GHG81796.1 hypothetical protein GCM10017788_51860 [Amycolatopsis acidiphila]